MGVLIKSHTYELVIRKQHILLYCIIQNMGVLIKSHSFELMIGKQHILHMLAHYIQHDFLYINTFLH